MRGIEPIEVAAMRWLQGVVGAALALVGASGLGPGTWLARVDVGLGALATLAALALPEVARRSAAWGAGVACGVLFLAGQVRDEVPWLPWFTLAFGVGLAVCGGVRSPAVRVS